MFDKIVFCNCNGDAIDKEVKNQVHDLLSKSSTNQIEINDLCGLSATNSNLVKETFDSKEKILILACHKRAVKLLLEYAGLEDSENITIQSLRQDEAKENLSLLKDYLDKNQSNDDVKMLNSNPDWQAWYPVLDYSRCTSCGQCADFCLFGVYEKKEGKVEVVNPDGCKINCPACARICPQIAIVFPKYAKGGAISGSEKFDEQEEQKRQLEDMDTILGGDIYKALELRKTKRKSIIKDDAMKKAIEERNKALNNKDN